MNIGDFCMSIEEINKNLTRDFGYFDGYNPKFRLVWSEDQMEKRLSHFTPEGFALIHPEVIEVPKYRQWIDRQFVLEKISEVPEGHEELSVNKLSYEPIWTFRNHEYIPSYAACRFVVENLLTAMGHTGYKRYKDPEEGLSKEDKLQKREAELAAIQSELFGNETEVGDALAYKQGITVPSNYKKETIQ